MIRSEDIIAPFPGGQGVHIAAEGAIGSRGDSEAVIEHQLVKKAGDSRLALDIGKYDGGMLRIANNCQGEKNGGVQ